MRLPLPPVPGPGPFNTRFQCEWASRNVKRQKRISHTFLWSPCPKRGWGMAKLFSISNLIYDIESILPEPLPVCVYVRLCLSVFALRSASIFHISQHFLRSFSVASSGLPLMSGSDTDTIGRGLGPKPPEPTFCFRGFPLPTLVALLPRNAKLKIDECLWLNLIGAKHSVRLLISA